MFARSLEKFNGELDLDRAESDECNREGEADAILERPPFFVRIQQQCKTASMYRPKTKKKSAIWNWAIRSPSHWAPHDGFPLDQR